MKIKTSNEKTFMKTKNANKIVKVYALKKFKNSKKYQLMIIKIRKSTKNDLLKDLMKKRYEEKFFDMFYNKHLSRT